MKRNTRNSGIKLLIRFAVSMMFILAITTTSTAIFYASGDKKTDSYNGLAFNSKSSLEEATLYTAVNTISTEEVVLTVVEETYIEEREEVDNTNYQQLIEDCLKDPMNNSFSQVKEYEVLRNEKIEKSGKTSFDKTFYFFEFNSWNELFESGIMDEYFMTLNQIYIVQAKSGLKVRSGPSTDYDCISNLSRSDKVMYLGVIVNDNNETWYRIIDNNENIGYVNSEYLKIFTSNATYNGYTEDDVYWLATAITNEVGSYWMPEWLRNYVGCVVLNRVESSAYPNTIYEVLFQKNPLQYSWTIKKYVSEPYDYCVETAIDLLEGNRMLPTDVIFQANFPQGNFTHETYYDEHLGTTTYFCGRR